MKYNVTIYSCNAIRFVCTCFPLKFSFSEYIQLCIDGGDKISLIITDYNHPGHNGFEFAKVVRNITAGYDRIPVLMLTMVDYYDMPAHPPGINHKDLVTKYMGKASSAKEILEFIRSI